MKRRTFIATILGATAALFTGKPSKALALMEGPLVACSPIIPTYWGGAFPTAANLNRNWIVRVEDATGFRSLVTGTYVALPKPFAEREGLRDTKGFFVDSSLDVVRVFTDGTVEKWSR